MWARKIPVAAKIVEIDSRNPRIVVDIDKSITVEKLRFV